MHSRSPYRRPRARKSRGRGLRTTNGCITCRKRHLKCDEVKPICGACAKNNKICEFATSGRRSVNLPASDGAVTETVPDLSAQQSAVAVEENERAPSTAQTNPPLSELREAIVPGWHSSTVDSDLSQPPQLDQLTGSQPDSNQSLVALTDASLSPSNSSFAAIRWFGLLANDAAKDSSQVSTIDNSWVNQGFSLQGHSNPDGQTQLSSLQCATLVLDAPSSIYASDDPTHAGASDGNTLGDEQIWQSREQIELLPGEETLFEHFVTRVSPWIDLFDHTSQFSTFVAHLAIYNAGLMNAILALAYRHLALNPHLSDHNVPNKQEAALQYYYQTLHYVQKAMQYSGYKRSLELLATTLIISAYEMLDNSTKDWERHLEGVFLIQRSQTIHGESGGLHSAVWWAWLCQDIWAAFREKRKTLTFWVPQKPLSELSPHELSRRSIYNTAKVISYCADTVTEADIGRRVDEANHLRKMLDDWQRHLTIEFSPLPLGSGHQSYFRPIWICPPAFAVAVQLFSVSHILLLAHEPSLGGIEQYLRRQSVIKHCVENICGIAVTLKDNPSSIMSSQALYIAGLFAQGHNTRKAILELLEACRERSGWPVRSLGEDLQHLWADHEPTKEAAAANLARSIP
ncbi:Adhesion and hyphal regulator [Penicillium chrysogenum]|uniref:Adhesion and hyphal regulator n=2 Tax=Penicillium chrysogenum species complex TaxID=254878 RepID=A0A167S464_PENCH|nr:Adhesion and hyphal regulator [Penicillium chrysogenum]